MYLGVVVMAVAALVPVLALYALHRRTAVTPDPGTAIPLPWRSRVLASA